MAETGFLKGRDSVVLETKRFRLVGVVLLLAVVVRGATGIAVQPVLVTTGGGDSNALGGAVQGCILSWAHPGGSNIVVAIGRGGAGKVFGIDGSLKYSGNAGYAGDYCELGLVGHNSGTLVAAYNQKLVGVDYAHLVTSSLTCMGATCTFSGNSDPSINKEPLLPPLLPVSGIAPQCEKIIHLFPGHSATSYFYMIVQNPTSEYSVVKVDMPTPVASSLAGGSFTYGTPAAWNTQCPSSKPAWRVDFVDGLTGLVNCGSTLILFDGTSLVHSAVVDGLENHHFVIDNTANTRMLLGTFSPSPSLKLAATPISGGTTLLIHDQLSITSEASVGMANMGVFPFYLVPLALSNNMELLLVSKLAAEIVLSTALAGYSANLDSLAQPIATSELELIVAFGSDSTSKNVMMHKYIMTLCDVWSGPNCVQCPLGAYLLDGSPTEGCTLLSDLPKGFGVDILSTFPTLLAKQCQATNCVECISNFKICQKCASYSNTVLAAAADCPWTVEDACILPENIQAGYGTDLSSLRVTVCADTGCEDCRLDKRICSKCKQGYYLDAAGICVVVTSLPARFGVDSASTHLFPCPTGCLKCNTNLLICQECDTANNYHLRSATGLCVKAPTELTEKESPQSGGVLGACSDINCFWCPTSPSICARCQQTSGFFLDENSPPVCVHRDTLPPKYGVNYKLGTTSKCQGKQDSCLTCPFSFDLCLECDKSLGWYLLPSNSSCINQNEMPTGFGPNLELGVVSPCRAEFCSDCHMDQKICIRCNKGYDLDSKAQRCFSRTPISIKSAYFAKSPQTITIIFDEKLLNKDFTSLLSLKILDATEAEFVDYKKNIVFKQDDTQRIISVSLEFTKSISNGRAIIEQMLPVPVFESVDNFYPAKSAIVVKDINKLIVSTSLPMTPEATAQLVQSAGGSSKLVLTALSPGAATGMQLLSSYFQFLRNLDGPVLAYPDLVLSMFSESNLLPWEFPPNLFLEWSSNIDCNTKDPFAANEIKCNIFTNYGSDLISLGSFILFCVLLGIGTHFLRRYVADDEKSSTLRNNSPTTWNISVGRDQLTKRTVEQGWTDQATDPRTSDPLFRHKYLRYYFLFQSNFGWKFFFVTMQGNSMHIIGYAVINLLTRDSSIQQLVGLGLAVIGLLFYLVYCSVLANKIALMNRVKRKWRRRQERIQRMSQAEHSMTDTLDTKNQVSNPESPEASENKQVHKEDKNLPPFFWINLQNTAFGAAAFQLEDLKTDLPKEWFYLMPVWQIFRYLTLQLTAYLASGYSFVQLSMILIIELLWMSLSLYTRINKNKAENVLEQATNILTCLFLIGKLCSLHEGLDPQFLQNVLGVGMAIILLLVVCLQFLVMLGLSVTLVFQILKSLFTKKKVTPTSSHNQVSNQREYEGFSVKQDCFEEKSSSIIVIPPEASEMFQDPDLHLHDHTESHLGPRSRFLSSVLESSMHNEVGTESTGVTSHWENTGFPGSAKANKNSLIIHRTNRKFRIRQPNDPVEEHHSRVFWRGSAQLGTEFRDDNQFV